MTQIVYFFQLSALCRKLDELWTSNEFCEVLFTWTTFLKNDVIELLRISSPLDLNHVLDRRRIRRRQSSNSSDTASAAQDARDSAHKHTAESKDSGSSAEAALVFDPRAIQDIASQDFLLPTILEHNQLQRQRRFECTLYTCDICFMEKLGNLCTEFHPCTHVFCQECIRGYLEVQIADGNVTELHCPYSKCESQASPSQVLILYYSLFSVRIGFINRFS